MNWFRYVDFYYGDEYTHELKLDLRRYAVIRETPKGVWLSMGDYSKPKFVLKDARRRFAYPTEALALKSYIVRKRHQKGHGQRTIDRAEEGLALAAKLKAEP